MTNRVNVSYNQIKALLNYSATLVVISQSFDRGECEPDPTYASVDISEFINTLPLIDEIAKISSLYREYLEASAPFSTQELLHTALLILRESVALARSSGWQQLIERCVSPDLLRAATQLD